MECMHSCGNNHTVPSLVYHQYEFSHSSVCITCRLNNAIFNYFIYCVFVPCFISPKGSQSGSMFSNSVIDVKAEHLICLYLHLIFQKAAICFQDPLKGKYLHSRHKCKEEDQKYISTVSLIPATVVGLWWFCLLISLFSFFLHLLQASIFNLLSFLASFIL